MEHIAEGRAGWRAAMPLHELLLAHSELFRNFLPQAQGHTGEDWWVTGSTSWQKQIRGATSHPGTPETMQLRWSQGKSLCIPATRGWSGGR